MNATQYSLLFSLGDLLGLFVVIIVGFLLSKYGRRYALAQYRLITIIVLITMIIGCLLTFLGSAILNYYVLLIGQTICMCVINVWVVISSTYLSIWFKNRETAFSMSMDTLCCYLSNSISFYIHPKIYNKFGSLKGNFFLMFILAVLGLIHGVLLCYLDSYAPPDEDEKKENEEEQGFSWSEIKRLPSMVWILAGGEITILQAFSLQDILSSKMFQSLFGLTNEEAGVVVGVPSIVLGLLSIVAGIIIYRLGCKPHTSNFF